MKDGPEPHNPNSACIILSHAAHGILHDAANHRPASSACPLVRGYPNSNATYQPPTDGSPTAGLGLNVISMSTSLCIPTVPKLCLTAFWRCPSPQPYQIAGLKPQCSNFCFYISSEDPILVQPKGKSNEKRQKKEKENRRTQIH